MNRNRHMQYRRSVYRRRRIRTVIITVAVAIVVFVALFLVIGNVMFDKTANDTEAPVKAEEEINDFSLPADSVKKINGYGVSLLSDANTLYVELDKAQTSGAISILMNAETGELYHSSALADGLGLTVATQNAFSVSEVSEAAKARSLYVSGIYYVSAFSVEDELLRSVAMSELAATIAESLRSGLDEVILSAPNISVEQIAEVTHLVSEIRTFVPNATIGFALPEAVASAAESENAQLIDDLAYSVSFLALDLSRYGEDNPTEFAEARVGTMLYSLLRYKMRVIIPKLDDGAVNEQIVSAVENAGVSNWQMLA